MTRNQEMMTKSILKQQDAAAEYVETADEGQGTKDTDVTSYNYYTYTICLSSTSVPTSSR